MNLFKHQVVGAETLFKSEGYLLAWDMGTGKTRTSIKAALDLFAARKIERVLVLCPAAVRFAWGEELGKLLLEGAAFTLLSYKNEDQQFYRTIKANQGGGKLAAQAPGLPICIISYALLRQERHLRAITKFCYDTKTALICDESSFLKTRSAEQVRGAQKVAAACVYRWLLSGTPVTNSPLDLWSQAEVMYPVRSRGPLHDFKNFYHFRASYGNMGGFKAKEWIADPVKIAGLQDRFKRFSWRVEKKECLDLPTKSYTVRQVELSVDTWRIYEQLRQEALLALPDSEAKPQPNAAVRILRLAQITSGHVGGDFDDKLPISVEMYDTNQTGRDISAEKIDWLIDALIEGELSTERAVIVWCRWRRERERLVDALLGAGRITFQVFGSQPQARREAALFAFQNGICERVLVAQPHAGGYGLNLTAAHTAIYMSNDYSVTARMQSEDRMHRQGQVNPCLYVDVVATGPSGQQTIDLAILQALREKQELAKWTCSAWRRILA